MAPRTGYAGGPLPRYLLLGATLFLLLGGMVMVYSASSVADYVHLRDSAFHLKKHVLGAGLGVALMLTVMSVDYRRVRWAWIAIYSASLCGLLLVLMIGVSRWGATRWLDLGPLTVQPSEFAKVGCVMISALLIEQYRTGRITSGEFWRRLFVMVGAVLALVLFQPDMGTALSIALSVYLMLVLGGVSGRILGLVAATGVTAAAALIAIAPYRLDRVLAFFDPWADPQGSGYQSIQALYAFGSGGVDGVGLGMSRQKFFYLPAAHTDFIFAIIGEELGLIGTSAVLAAFVVLAYAGVRIALGTRDAYGRLLAGGLTSMLVTQALVNMAAVTGLVPVTGIPMPLVSAGGSSMTLTLLSIGMILSVSNYGARAERRGRSRTEESAVARATERRGNRRPHLSCVDGGRSSARRRA